LYTFPTFEILSKECYVGEQIYHMFSLS
jgi:hypothetical protein